jgi:hypothetical protein
MHLPDSGLDSSIWTTRRTRSDTASSTGVGGAASLLPRKKEAPTRRQLVCPKNSPSIKQSTAPGLPWKKDPSFLGNTHSLIGA